MVAAQRRTRVHARSLLVVSAVGVAALVAGSVLGALPAQAAYVGGSAACNATGGTVTASTSEGVAGNFYHTFTSGGTFHANQAFSVTWLAVGGGGAGGNAAAATAGGGGGGGEVRTGTFTTVANTDYAITIGAGGTAGSGNTAKGNPGGDTSIVGGITNQVANGGQGGAAGLTNTSTVTTNSGSSTGGGGGAATGSTVTAGNAQAPGGRGGAGRTSDTSTRRSGGGGGGDGGNGVAGGVNNQTDSGLGGAGGAGTTNNNNATSTSLRYGAGGGGGGFTVGGAGGSTNIGGIGGAASNGFAPTTANRGSGGGGAGNNTSTATTGGAGSAGIVIIRYAKNASCPNAPVATFSSPTLSWSAPSSIPGGQTIFRYTVLYRLGSRTGRDGWAIFARKDGILVPPSAPALPYSLNLSNCAGNAGWTCVLGEGFTANTTYDFRVIARTNTSALSPMSNEFSYTSPP